MYRIRHAQVEIVIDYIFSFFSFFST